MAPQANLRQNMLKRYITIDSLEHVISFALSPLIFELSELEKHRIGKNECQHGFPHYGWSLQQHLNEKAEIVLIDCNQISH